MNVPAAEVLMRRLLRVTDTTEGASHGGTALFGASIVLSALRCLATYVLLPVAAPVVEASADLAPMISVALALVSSVAVIAAARRVWTVDHSWRWQYTALGALLLAWLSAGIFQDAGAFVG